MTDYEVEVPTLEMVLEFAEDVSNGDNNILESQFYRYSDELNSLMLEIREGKEYSDEVEQEIKDLYASWEEDGFPQEDDEDVITEGSPEDFAKAMKEMEASGVDVDAIPDPEDL